MISLFSLQTILQLRVHSLRSGAWIFNGNCLMYNTCWMNIICLISYIYELELKSCLHVTFWFVTFVIFHHLIKLKALFQHLACPRLSFFAPKVWEIYVELCFCLLFLVVGWRLLPDRYIKLFTIPDNQTCSVYHHDTKLWFFMSSSWNWKLFDFIPTNLDILFFGLWNKWTMCNEPHNLHTI